MSGQPVAWEMGSEFHWDAGALSSAVADDWLPRDHGLFSTGRGALQAALAALARSRPIGRVFLPSYFCMDVVTGLVGAYRIAWYRDIPTEPQPDPSGVEIGNSDVVVAANLFGQRSGAWWAEAIRARPAVRMVEDHSHDPLSDWSRDSTADYAFASLRKTMPVPDGALLWSPLGLEAPRPQNVGGRGALLKLMAMNMKDAYLRGAPVDPRAYRELQLRGEDELIGERDHAACTLTAHMLRALDVRRCRETRADNVSYFYEEIHKLGDCPWRPLRAAALDGNVLFCGLLVCDDGATRDRLRRFLVDNRLYCPVHWPQPLDGISSGDEDAISLSSRVLSIPLDHRYSRDDVDRVVGLLRDFASDAVGMGAMPSEPAPR